jgi:hypothetical protein
MRLGAQNVWAGAERVRASAAAKMMMSGPSMRRLMGRASAVIISVLSPITVSGSELFTFASPPQLALCGADRYGLGQISELDLHLEDGRDYRAKIPRASW